MTRIAYVSGDLGVPIFGRKGCSIHAQEVLRSFLRQGAQVDLFSTSLEDQPVAGLEAVRLHRLPRPTTKDPAAREQAALAANTTLRSELERAGQFDLVYERYSLWTFAAMDYARENGVPGLLEVNAPLIEEQVNYRVLVDRPAAERVAQRVFDAAAWLLPVSDEVAAYLEQFVGLAPKVRVVPNGVRPDRFPPNLAPTLPAPAGLFTIGFVGSLKAWHGLSVLLEAFARFRERHPYCRLLLVGDGPEREKLAAQAAQRGVVASLHFTGAVSAEEVPGLLASMDVAVAPYPKLSEFYFSPLKVYEYMAAGLPVVASRIGQLEKLIEPGGNGLLVSPGDPAELAAAFHQLHNQPDLRRRLGQTARASVLSQYTWDSVVQRICRIAGVELADPTAELREAAV
jgi:glycosyltransferase involved in cell wall biosynthesis